MITEKNTKKEIWQAYKDLLAEKEAEKKHEGISVVIPFVSEFAQGNELQYALRGWAKNFIENFNLVIVGDRLPWMADDLAVIDAPRESKNPPIDIAEKMLKVIESDLVSEKFIWAHDDQYLISPCHTADFEALKCVGKLENADAGSVQYRRNKESTLNFLKDLEKSTWDFSTHSPVVYEKQKLLNLINRLNLTENAMLVSSLYFNLFFPRFIPYNLSGRNALLKDNFRLGVFCREANLKLMQELMPGKKMICNSELGWTPELDHILKETFPEKCRYEK